MKVHGSLVCFFFLSLQDGNTGVISADIPIITEKEGGNITHECFFFFSGHRKIFCKRECKEKDVLIQTDEDRAQNGRFSIEYRRRAVFSDILLVSITNLTKSDSGRYRCGLDRFWSLDSKEDFEIKVQTAPTASEPSWTLRPFSASVPAASTPTTTKKSSAFSPGGSTASSASPETNSQSEQQQTASAAGSGVLLYMGLTLGVLLIILSAAVLIFCRKKASKPKEPPAHTEYANVTEANREYEEIRQSRSPPVELSTVYSCIKFTELHAETTDDYSFVNATSSQRKTEDASDKLTYSQVHFSHGAAASLHSAPRGDADDIVYSMPRVQTSSGGRHTKEASPPLYSTVAVHQL